MHNGETSLAAEKATRRLAVATKDGTSISQHFGHAKLFYVYEVVLDTRKILYYCIGHPQNIVLELYWTPAKIVLEIVWKIVLDTRKK